MAKKQSTPPQTIVDKLSTVTTEEELSVIYENLSTDAAVLKEELIHMIVHVVQLQLKNQELINQLAEQQGHVESMERQIIQSSNVIKPEPSEIDELSLLIEAALREEAQVHVSVNVVKSEQREFTFG